MQTSVKHCPLVRLWRQWASDRLGGALRFLLEKRA